MKAFLLVAAPALALAACTDNDGDAGDTAIDTVPNADAGTDPAVQEGGTIDADDPAAGAGFNTNRGLGGSDAAGSVSDGPMPGPDSGEAGEGGTNPNDTDVGLDDSEDSPNSY